MGDGNEEYPRSSISINFFLSSPLFELGFWASTHAKPSHRSSTLRHVKYKAKSILAWFKYCCPEERHPDSPRWCLRTPWVLQQHLPWGGRGERDLPQLLLGKSPTVAQALLYLLGQQQPCRARQCGTKRYQALSTQCTAQSLSEGEKGLAGCRTAQKREATCPRLASWLVRIWLTNLVPEESPAIGDLGGKQRSKCIPRKSCQLIRITHLRALRSGLCSAEEKWSTRNDRLTPGTHKGRDQGLVRWFQSVVP